MPAAVSDQKLDQEKNLNRLLDSYERMVFVNLNNVTSQQMHKIRRELIGSAEMVVGKKTTQKKIMSLRAERAGASANDAALAEKMCRENLLAGNVALTFTNKPVSYLVNVFTRFRVQAPARVGAISPVEVMISAGNTGMEPTMTSFFQALQIMTKISKGTVEIVSDKRVLSPGDKVDTSTAALLQKLKISPFFYNPEVVGCWEKGMFFTSEDLELTDAAMEEAFLAGLNNLTGLSLGSGIVTELSLPHAIADGFKKLLAASVESDYAFTEYNGKQLRDDIKSGKSASAAPAAAAAAAPASKKKEPEPEPEEDDDLFGGGLF